MDAPQLCLGGGFFYNTYFTTLIQQSGIFNEVFVVSPLRHVLPRARADAFRACADRLTDDGVDLAGYSLPQRVDDLEAARRALGYGRIDLLSESAGTRTAMIYAWRYPKSIHRSVMIGVNPPGHFLWDAKTTDEQIRRYAALCAEDESCSEPDAGISRPRSTRPTGTCRSTGGSCQSRRGTSGQARSSA